MSSLRNFRFQKVRKPAATSVEATDSQGNGTALENGVASSSPSALYSVDTNDSQSQSQGATGSAAALDSSTSSPPFVPPQAKRPRVLSDDDPSPSPSSSNGAAASAAAMPSPDVMEARLDCLQKTYPDKDLMELQDALQSCEWSVQRAYHFIRLEQNKKNGNVKGATGGSTSSEGGNNGESGDAAKRPAPQANFNAKQKYSKVKKAKLSRYSASARVVDQENSESDSEGEYNDNNIVYDSEDSEEEQVYDDDEAHLTDDKRRVLNFFNKATDHELACIQGCSKKKAESVVELRPFTGWGDLIQKLQLSRHLNTEMLNHTTMLIKMRDAVAKLMDKCEKITRKMESMVEDLTMRGNTQQMELTEQPGIMSGGKFKLTGYQMIGLNWLVLMHKQSLNGILADEMGLGKTIQAIAFLAHMKEKGDGGPHLIIVPSSTMENWLTEFGVWCPSIKVLNYYGSQDERRHMRVQIVNEEVEYDVILTTYNMVLSSADDRVLFRKLAFHYVIFDEAHMLKNMATARYENLMRVQASRKLLLTGTPLQNNLVELMSLLVFVMPEMFANKKEQLKKMFALFPKSQEQSNRSRYEKDRIAHAKRIMKPFFLRRLKSEVLTELPNKTEHVLRVPMSQAQYDLYCRLVSDYKERAKAIAAGAPRDPGESGVGLLMNLRKAAQHPLLIRNNYDDEQCRNLAKILKKQDAGHANAVVKYITEDLSVLSDFHIHKTCLHYRAIEHLSLGNHQILDSGKFAKLDELLPDMKERGDRVLLFSQFTMVMDIMEQYLRIRGHKYLRLDGSTPVQERQLMINQFNRDDSIFIFMLSTKAGGLGINLTAANTVILHDIDFNPYNDKQAEDRCHRVGQVRPVTVYRFLSEDTIEEGIYTIATDKLKLEKDLAASGEGGEDDGAAGGSGASAGGGDPSRTRRDLKKLLKIALNVDMSEKAIGDVDKVYTEL